jgi:endo-1,4-beta-xylanase
MSGKLVLPAVISTLLAACCLSGLYGQDSSWRTEANARIDEIRKRDVRISVVDEQGKPVPGVRIDMQQKRKAFPFGAAMNGFLISNTQYREFFKSHFNWAVFENESKWYSNEKISGQEDYKTADTLCQWCQDNNIPVRGHCVFWAPERWQMQWVRDLNPEDLRTAVERRLDSAIRHFAGRFVHWDVNNEMLHGTFFRDRLGEDILLWMFKRAHELDPDVKLFVNEFNILSVDQNFTEIQLDEYIKHTQQLLDKGAPISGIGIQGHVWREDITEHPKLLKTRLDKVAALDLPVWITEFDVADANENSNAEKLEIVYRTAYGHPGVEGIMTWVFWAGSSWRGPNAGLARKDWTLTEAGLRYEALMAEWSTNASGTTDASGIFSCRGFFGDYAVTVAPEKAPPVNQIFTLVPGQGAQLITVSVP